MKPTKADFEMRYKMKDVIDYIVRNYKEFPEEFKDKDVAYSISTTLFYHLVEQAVCEGFDEERFLKRLMKLSVHSEDSLIQLFVRYISPKNGQCTLIPTQVNSNLTENKDGEQIDEIFTVLFDSSTIEKIMEEDKMTENELNRHTGLWLCVKNEYAKYLLEHDEKKIREELVLQERSLRKQLKETGTFKSLKRESLRL